MSLLNPQVERDLAALERRAKTKADADRAIQLAKLKRLGIRTDRKRLHPYVEELRVAGSIHDS